MFNLNQAIADWRREMLAGGIKTPVPLDELESHLRDDIEQLMRSGSSAQQAFEVSVLRIGKSGMLKNEFKKIRRTPSLSSKFIISIGLAFVGFIILLSSFTIFVCFESWGERLTASAAVAFTLLVACGWRRAVPFLPVIANKGKRAAIGLTCIACGFGASSLFCGVILPHFEVSPDHQLPAIGLWAVFLIAIFTCAGVGLAMSEHEREHWGMKKPARRTSTPAHP